MFQNRADELFVLTSGMTMDAHTEILDSVRAQFADITLEATVGCADGALDASRAAHQASNSADKTQSVYGEACKDDSDTMILHMDVDGLSEMRARLSPYEITVAIYALYSEMSSFFMSRGSLAFFMGGDNFMIITGSKSVHDDADEFLRLADTRGITLNCGIGRGRTARKAASNATRSLDEIRRMRKTGSAKRVYEAHNDTEKY